MAEEQEADIKMRNWKDMQVCVPQHLQ